MKNYAIMRISKLKTAKQFMDAYKHNFRVYNVTNADEARRGDNQEIIDLNGKTYEQAAEDAIAEMKIKGAIKEKIRKDAVRGFEVVLRYSREADEGLDHDKWVEENVRWLRDTFNPPGGVVKYTDADGIERETTIDNVKSVVVHNDEGCPHIHAFIVPIDENGHLNSQAYIGDRSKFVQMQNSYAKAMKPFGLSRGEYYSVATPEQVSRYYRELKKPLEEELPIPQKGETVEEYRDRANEVFQNAATHHRNEIVKMNQQIVQAKSEALLAANRVYEQEREAVKEIKKMRKEFGDKELDAEMIRDIRVGYEKNRDFEEGVKNHPDRYKASNAEQLYDELSSWTRKSKDKNRRGTESEEPERIEIEELLP